LKNPPLFAAITLQKTTDVVVAPGEAPPPPVIDENAQIINSIFAGVAGPPRDIVLLNAGAAIYLGGQAGSIEDGVELARSTIDSGAAAATLERYLTRSAELAAQ
jgi:anthranilate phosphoribosyltransferase